jgi:hypothetical protein
VLGSSKAVDGGQNLSRKCDGSLLFHTTIILP